MSAYEYDAVVVGAGPNGLSAAVTLAQHGLSVLCVERAAEPGGGTRTAELIQEGVLHDVCSAIHPLVLASPYLSRLPLAEHGLELVHPEIPVAHPLPDGSAATLERSVSLTAARLGNDEKAYRKLMGPLVAHGRELSGSLLEPLRIPRNLTALVRFGLPGIRSARGLARSRFDGEPARALLGGLAAHSMLPLTSLPTAGVGLLLGLLAHHVGWPAARGGSQRIADALVSLLEELGGRVETATEVTSLEELPSARCYLLDLTPRGVAGVAGERLPSRYLRSLGRYRYGPGVFKVDYVLKEPVPWTAEACRRAGTVHVGGTLEELVASERDVCAGRIPERPYVLIAQQSLFDPTRAPEGTHTLWAYCHVPSGSDADMTERIESQIERFAPGFRDVVAARISMTATEVEDYNPNYVGGDINGGAQDLLQHVFRPVVRWDPYSTPAPDVFICSSATPPGGGVHGMGGHLAARSALRRVFGISEGTHAQV